MDGDHKSLACARSNTLFSWYACRIGMDADYSLILSAGDAALVDAAQRADCITLEIRLTVHAPPIARLIHRGHSCGNEPRLFVLDRDNGARYRTGRPPRISLCPVWARSQA
jgi:hypothetical protein